MIGWLVARISCLVWGGWLMASRAEQLFSESIRAIKRLAAAERAANLRRERYRRFDSRGVHVLSYEIGRAQALADLHRELGDVYPERLIAEAWDEADRKWRSQHAVGVLVDAVVERNESDLEYGERLSADKAQQSVSEINDGEERHV